MNQIVKKMCGIVLLINALKYSDELDLPSLHKHTRGNAHYEWDKYWPPSPMQLNWISLCDVLDGSLSAWSSGWRIILLEPGCFFVEKPQVHCPEEEIQKSEDLYVQIVRIKCR